MLCVVCVQANVEAVRVAGLVTTLVSVTGGPQEANGAPRVSDDDPYTPVCAPVCTLAPFLVIPFEKVPSRSDPFDLLASYIIMYRR